MATYLVLSNRVLNALNEVEMTSSNFSSSRGIQTAIKNFVNRALHDIYNEIEELPSLHKETYHVTNSGQREYALPTANSPVSGDLQWRKIDWDTFYLKPNELLTNGEFTSDISSWTTIAGSGSAAYNSGGNGRLRLNDYAAYQSFSTTKDAEYRIQVNAFFQAALGHSLVNTWRAFFEPRIGSQFAYNFVNTKYADDNLKAAAFSSLYVEKADYFKLANLTVSYDLGIAGNTISSASVSLNVRNAFVITDYTGADPTPSIVDGGYDAGGGSLSNTGNILAPGIDRRNNYFDSRSFTLGLNINF